MSIKKEERAALKIKKKERKKSMKRSSIGGQAVLEGVMMQGVKSTALAVRDAEGKIRIQSKRVKSKKERCILFRIPIIRGFLNFFMSLWNGIKTILASGEVYVEEEPSKTEKWVAKKFHINIVTVIMIVSVVLGLALAIGLFILLPGFLAKLIVPVSNVYYSLIDGGLRLVIFFLYLLLTMFAKDIRRLFRYHGAEHKVINCYEHGEELTVENVQKYSTYHNRCGTTFIFFVMMIGIILFSFITFESFWARVLVKILLLPATAGIAYELLKLLALSDCWILIPFKLPGMLLQKITTSQPDDSMVEVALTAFKTVMELDENPEAQTVDTISTKTLKEIKEEIESIFKNAELTYDADIDWILCSVVGIKRSELVDDKKIIRTHYDKIIKIAKERATGKPLWYVIGNVDFYNVKIEVDENVLIPRAETEELVFEALKLIKEESKVLDVCTGSGCIAIAIQKEKKCNVKALDISPKALEVARKNAEKNLTKVDFIESDLLHALKEDEKFDVIISNPPYIKSADISGLSKEVQSEPLIALDGGVDGLDFYRKIIDQAKAHLNRKGYLIFEVGFDQAKQVEALMDDYQVKIVKDLDKIERIIIGRMI